VVRVKEKIMETRKTYPVPVFRQGLNKAKINELADSCVSVLLEDGSPIELAEVLSAMELFIKQVKGDVRFTDFVRDELNKENGKTTTSSGAKIECAEVGVEYDFSKCGDSEFEFLESSLIAATEKLKARKDFLKTIPASGMTIVSTLTGEVETIYPPLKYSKSSFKVTLGK
jgi:hypothetical protein